MSHRGTILLIDDEEAQLLMASKVLETQGGYKCISFADPEKGLKRALENDLDLIILDVIMPGMSGLSIAMEIRDNEQATPILFYSGELDEATVIQANQLEHTSVLRKAGKGVDNLLTSARSAIGQSRTTNAIYQMKGTVKSLTGGQKKLFSGFTEIKTALKEIKGAMVTEAAVEAHFVEVTEAVGSDEEPSGEVSEAVRRAKNGLARAIVKEVDKVAFSDFLNRILTSKAAWAITLGLLGLFAAYVRAGAATAVALQATTLKIKVIEREYGSIQADYRSIQTEQRAIRKDLGDVKQMLQQVVGPSVVTTGPKHDSTL